MQIASQVYGIETAGNALCFFEDDKPAYITRRFDVHSGGKYKQEDFAALLGWSKDITAEMLTNFGTNEHPHKAAETLITY